MASPDPYNLKRFIEAQNGVFVTALQELRSGRKQSHWMWFVFPQLAGLGLSPTSIFYAISSPEEAGAYLAHPVLGARLRQSLEALSTWAGQRTAEQILGPIDAVKLRSSVTLFDAVSPEDVFRVTLESFFGSPDERTLALLSERR